MSAAKRKSTSQGEERPSKKQQTTSNITVKYRDSGDVQPVIGHIAGINFPKEIKFKSFSRKANGGSSRLLLQSNEHPTIDYTATEGDSSTDEHLKHYIAVFNPNTGELEVTEARKLNVRSTIRSLNVAQDQDEGEDGTVPVTNYSTRAALTEAFGTKKSRKAVQSMAENRLLAQGNEEADNPVSAAMMSGIINDEDEDQNAPGVDSDEAALVNKPIPRPNLHTNEIALVYSLDAMVQPTPAKQTLDAMPINKWVARISAKKDVTSRSRFVASRVGYLTKHLIKSPEASDPNLKQNLQVLRYIQILLDIHSHVRNLPHRRPVPRVGDWADGTFSEGTPMSIASRIPSHFFKGDRLPTTQALTLLRTTILALTLHVPPPSLHVGQGMLATEISDIGLDLATDSSEVRKLYRELGCKVEPATEAELSRWGLEKLSKRKKAEGTTTGAKLLFAKLKLPLVFPKVSRGKPQGRR